MGLFKEGKTSLCYQIPNHESQGKQQQELRLKAYAEFTQLICLCWQECLACLSVGHAPEPSQCLVTVPAYRTAFWALPCSETRSPMP